MVSEPVNVLMPYKRKNMHVTLITYYIAFSSALSSFCLYACVHVKSADVVPSKEQSFKFRRLKEIESESSYTSKTGKESQESVINTKRAFSNPRKGEARQDDLSN